MTDYFDFDSVPCEEKCEQVGTLGYNPVRARAECRAYLKQIRRMHGRPPEGCRLVLRANPHDFGDYMTVAAEFDSGNKEAAAWALKVEHNLPAHWDDRARCELGLPDVLSWVEDHDD